MRGKNGGCQDKKGQPKEEESKPWQEHLGGEALVEAVFRKLFPEEFRHILPIRNHKVKSHP